MLKLLAPLGVENAGGGAHGGADVGPLNARGVPVIDLGQDSSLYFDVHHTASDTLAEIDEKDLNQAVAAFTATAWLLANAEGSFGRCHHAARRSADHASPARIARRLQPDAGLPRDPHPWRVATRRCGKALAAFVTARIARRAGLWCGHEA